MGDDLGSVPDKELQRSISSPRVGVSLKCFAGVWMPVPPMY